EINNVHVVNTTVNPTVDLSQTGTLGLEFKIQRTVKPTTIDIESTNTDPPDIILAGIIENPLGTTRVVNVHGSILSNASRGDGGVDASSFDPSSLIRTNILDLETKNGFIGQDPGDAFGQTATGLHRINVDIVDSAKVPSATNFLSARVNPADDTIL